MQYNTEEIERIAAKVAGLSENVKAAARGSLQRTAEELPSHFKGEAADERKKGLAGLGGDIRACGNQLKTLSEILYRYARTLREADEKAKSDIASR